jgi:predicted DNA-binding WGR domain protein
MTKVRTALTTVIQAMAVNPSYLGICPNPPSVLLKKSTPHGGKFWKAVAHPNGLALQWGRLNTAGQGRVLDISKCAQGNPVQEMMDRALAKINEGYGLCSVTT